MTSEGIHTYYSLKYYTFSSKIIYTDVHDVEYFCIFIIFFDENLFAFLFYMFEKEQKDSIIILCCRFSESFYGETDTPEMTQQNN